MSSETFFNLARLRTDIFVVEQQCVYPELDDHDADDSTLHVLGFSGSHELLACARILFTDSDTAKGCQLQVELSAQAYATQFYESLGFETVSGEYLEDGIEHVDMRLKSG